MTATEFEHGLSLVPKKYRKTLAKYSQWERCETPLQQFSVFLAPFWKDDEPMFAYQTPFQCLFVYESLGVKWSCADTDRDLELLWLGKNTRDWWAKEISEWKRLSGTKERLFSVHEVKSLLQVRSCFDEVLAWNGDI